MAKPGSDQARKGALRLLQGVREGVSLSDQAGVLKALTPYFLLRPSLKVLEFLIRTYNVQEHNVDDLLMCALPYHSTPQVSAQHPATRAWDKPLTAPWFGSLCVWCT